MKILLVTEFFPTGRDLRFSGGVEARTYYVAKHLTKNHQVSVLASVSPGTKSREKLSNIDVFRVGPARNYSASVGHLISRIKFIKNAIEFGSGINADIVEGGNYISHFIAKSIAQRKKIPAVAWYPDVWLGDWIKNATFYGVFGEILERYNLFRGFDAYIAISKKTQTLLSKYTKTKVHLIYCGVDYQEFFKRGNKFQKPVILCISRLASYKNIKTLVLAFANLSRSLPNIDLQIVGEGPEEKNLKNLVGNLKIKSKVKFHSNLPRKDLIALIKSSYVFCLPSKVEGFGIVTIEAASAGIPYVNSNIPVHVEVTKRGMGGFLADPDSPIDFSNKLSKLLSNKQLYLRKSQQARQLSKIYDWSQIAYQTEQVYKNIFKFSKI